MGAHISNDPLLGAFSNLPKWRQEQDYLRLKKEHGQLQAHVQELEGKLRDIDEAQRQTKDSLYNGWYAYSGVYPAREY